ncbi:MAG: nucleotidyl transferase AbiEii/AbiGii toxin family protein [Thaumarchaeota archaeon]|nr:nucleotidyl transferase AbiEii/AbiGii toxin family protein [Nitrososphaerota archaeon]
MMELENPLCLGGGHGVRTYLPQDLQRFSIDLGFCTNEPNIHSIQEKFKKFGNFKHAGYGLESEGKFKRYDSPLPKDLTKCTLALTKRYTQAFKFGDMPSEFYVTICNTYRLDKLEMRRPKSYIGFEYVKKEIPVLPAAQIIAGKIMIIPRRTVKDLYKDIFDVYCLMKHSGLSIERSEIVAAMLGSRIRMQRSEIYEKFKETSSASNARNAIKLPSGSKADYLKDWGSINSFVKNEALALLGSAKLVKS